MYKPSVYFGNIINFIIRNSASESLCYYPEPFVVNLFKLRFKLLLSIGAVIIAQ